MALIVSPAALVSTRSTRELAPVVDGVPQLTTVPERVARELQQVRDDDVMDRLVAAELPRWGWVYADPEWREGVAS
ncbi:MAG: hypothetical protein HOQ45_18475 [Nocardioidaceae bacterium]|nr:hypothetical protein [Nocardioidaceae bacterium]